MVPGAFYLGQTLKNGTASYLNHDAKKKPARIVAPASLLLFVQRAVAKSIEPGLDDRCERISSPIQPRFHRSKIAVRDLRDLLVRLAFQLAKHEDLPMMFRQLRHGILDQLAEMSLPVQVVRPCRCILELERPLLVFPIALDRLEEYEWVPRPIAEFILRQIRCNRIYPGGELLRAVESMNVPVHPDEDFLDQILGLLAIPDRSINEVQQPGLIALDQLLKCTLLSVKERGNDCSVVLRAEPFSNGRARKRRPLECDLSHLMPPFVLHQGSIRRI